jgi:DNA-binding transcriptional ArsR family regulator
MNIQEFEYKAGMAAGLLKALASGPRLMVLCHLAGGEKSVGEIACLTGLRMSAVSQNLAVLRTERLVTQRRDGTTIHYRLADPTARKVIEVLYRAFCNGRNSEKPRRRTRRAG